MRLVPRLAVLATAPLSGAALGALAALGILAACEGDVASPPLLLRPVPAEYFLIGYAEEHDSLRGFAAQCVLAGTIAFEQGSLDAYDGIGITAASLLRSGFAAAAASNYGDVRLSRDRGRSGGAVLLEVPPLDIVPARLEGVVDRDSTFRGTWPCATLAVTPPAGAGTDTVFTVVGRWALCPDSAHCSLSRPGSGGSPPPVQFEFPSLPRIR